jgi:tight adherence protein C
VNAVALLAAGVGLGLCIALSALFPARLTLKQRLADLDFEPGPPVAPPSSLDERLGRLLQRTGGTHRLTGPRSRTDLALLELPAATFVGAKVACGLAGLLVGPALAAVISLVGIRVGWQVPAFGSFALAAAGFFVPDIDLRTKAEKRRREFRRGLSSFLDVVTVALAAGELISGALQLAAHAGRGWVFVLLRSSLDDGDQRNATPWDTLAMVGTSRGLPELVEVAASVKLAGTDGARVRRTLSVKAEALRVRALTDAEAEASEATTRMVLPLVGVTLGFLVLVAYPATSHILSGG